MVESCDSARYIWWGLISYIDLQDVIVIFDIGRNANYWTFCSTSLQQLPLLVSVLCRLLVLVIEVMPFNAVVIVSGPVFAFIHKQSPSIKSPNKISDGKRKSF